MGETTEYRRRVLELYDTTVLSFHFEGEIKARLLTGLEDVLGEVAGLYSGAVIDDYVGSDGNSLLTRHIDYSAIKDLGDELGKKRSAQRAIMVLRENKIFTYRDLVVKYIDCCKRPGATPADFSTYLLRFRNMGKFSVDLVLRHLDSVGFQRPVL